MLEAVRAFYPAIYDCIRAGHEEFSGVESEHRSRVSNEPRAVAMLKPIINRLPVEEQDTLKSLLKELFPRLGSEYGGGGYGSDWLDPWAKKKRICSPDYCPRYFSYAVAKTDVRDSEMDALYEKALSGTEDEVRNLLEVFFTGGRARRVIERMRAREMNTDPKAVPPLCLAVASQAKHIPNPQSLFSVSEAPAQAAILITFLINRLPKGSGRVNLAKRVIAVADPLWFGAECLRWLHVTDDEDKADKNTLTLSEVKKVGKALVNRIETQAETGESLFNVEIRQEQNLLFEWCRVKGRKPVQRHLATLFKRNPQNIALFLQAMVPRTWGGNDILPQIGDLDRNQLDNIKLLFDLDALATLIKAHLPGDFDNPQWFPDRDKPTDQRLAEQFMVIYNKWKKEGEPPESPPRTESAPSREVDADGEDDE